MMPFCQLLLVLSRLLSLPVSLSLTLTIWLPPPIWMISWACPGPLSPLIDDPLSSFAPYYDDDISEAPTIYPVPCPAATEPHQALCALHSLDISRRSFYSDLRACAVASDLPVLQQGHMEGGSMVCTTDQRCLLWYFQDLVDSSVKLRVADNTPHTPQGIGYLRIPAGAELGYLDVKCYRTPTMPATILSSYAIGTQFKCRGYSIRNDFWGQACTVTFHHRLCQLQDISLTLSLRHGLLFTASFLSPTHAECSAVVPGPKLHAVTRIDAREGQVHPELSGTREGIDDMEGQPHCLRNCLSCTPTLPVVEPVPNKETPNYACLDRECPCVMHTMLQESDAYCLPCDTSSDMATPDPPPSYSINHLTRDQLHILWHQCLGHLHNRHMKLLSKTVIGVPDLATDDELHKCPVCMAAKLRKANKGTEDSRRATICIQGISIDAGFIVQSSKDSKWTQCYTGLNGETCYFTIVDHKSGTIYGEKCASKALPIEFVK
jgi:hypothetical protein